MTIKFNSDIETIRTNFARIRTAEPYSQPLVNKEMNDKIAEQQAAIANIAGCESMNCSSTYIAGASNNASLLSLVSEFNRFFAQVVVAPSKEGQGR